MRLLKRENPVRLLVTGSPYFVRQTSEIAFSSSAWRVYTPKITEMRRHPWRFALLLGSLQRAHLWYHIGGNTLRPFQRLKLLQAARLLGKPVVVHWIGSDILEMAPYFASDPECHEAAKKLTHWVTAPWFVEELAQMGLSAEFVPFTGKKRIRFLSENPPPLPNRFSVLAYVPDKQPALYGWGYLERLAADFPEIEIKVVSGTGAGVENHRPNVKFLGWVDDIYPAYRDCSLVVRMTPHDGYTGTVQEALLLGRHVIWTYPFPGALKANDYEALRGHVKALLDLHQQDQLKINTAGRDHIARHLHPDKLSAQIQQKIFNVIAAKRSH